MANHSKPTLLRQFILSLLAMGVLWLAAWLVLESFDLVGRTKQASIGHQAEQRIGDLLIEQLGRQYTPVYNPKLEEQTEALLQRLCTAAKMNVCDVQVHLFRSDAVNAFVIPGRHMVVFSGLAADTENAEEYAGVLAHELAHIVLDHVMERMVRELGSSLLLTLSGMDGPGELIAQVLRVVTTSRYSREQERQADLKAVELLHNAGIDPQPLAHFMLRMATRKRDVPDIPAWISTHPDSRDRASEIVERIRAVHKEAAAETIVEYEPVYAGNWTGLVRAVTPADAPS